MLIMQNTIKAARTVPEEELKKIQEMDWNSYYRDTAPDEAQGLTTCASCGAILLVREETPSDSCYKCGNKIAR
jgi:hypothetical protein